LLLSLLWSDQFWLDDMLAEAGAAALAGRALTPKPKAAVTAAVPITRVIVCMGMFPLLRVYGLTRSAPR
ncbi:hypothetical protein, partial [Arthrobacter sp. 2YAF22_2]|uniref:hypothetical protein n=1 Tax=Arthrobacter sp. 2YAF22_2 TaxID=3233029 RepID=UPI003F91960B